MITDLDNFFMDLAIDRAWEYQLLTYPNPAVGAVVVKEGRVLSIQAHQRAGTSHAEVLALIEAFENLTERRVTIDRFDAKEAHKFLLQNAKDIFRECEIFVTLEPCSHIGKTPSCASLIKSLNLKRVVIGSSDPISSHSGGVKILRDSGIRVDIGIRRDACDLLIEPFKIWQNRAFVIFKLAQTLNGRIGGGYISSKESLKIVHQIRAVSKKMLIGGNTIRIDRPTLDCRFIDSNTAPDIFIYSKRDDFDKTIPLFDIKGRSVKVVSDLDDLLSTPSLLLVEGGGEMLNAIRDNIDWLLIFQAPKLSTDELSYNITANLEYIRVKKLQKDLMIWSRFEK